MLNEPGGPFSIYYLLTYLFIYIEPFITIIIKTQVANTTAAVSVIPRLKLRFFSDAVSVKFKRLDFLSVVTSGL